MAQYYTLVTNKGTEKISSSVATGSKLNLTKFKVGDGGGSYYEPSVKQTALKNVKYEGDINSIKIETITVKGVENKVIKIEGIIPTDIGGFYIREVGLFDDSGDLIAIGKYCETYKPTADEGTAKEIIIRLVIDVENVESIDLSVNANMSIVTREDLETEIESVKAEITKAQIPYKVTEGSDNAYTCTLEDITEYTKGLAICIEPHADSTGASTLNINGLGAIEIKDGNGNSINAGGLKTGIPYNLRYNGVNFILQGKGGGGNAKPEQLVKGATATTDIGQIVGTMEQRKAFFISDSMVDYGFPEDSFSITESNMSGIGLCSRVTVSTKDEYLSNSVGIAIQGVHSTYVKSGVKVGGNRGFTGTFTSDANAQAWQILSGQSAYVNGDKITGTMVNLSSASTIQHESGNSTKVIQADGLFVGNNTDGVRRVSFRYNSSNGFITGNTLFGLPESTVASSLGITANKILSGNTICGVAGSATSMKRATGTVSVAYNGSTTVELGFYPTILIVRYDRKTKSGDAKWDYSVFSPTLIFSCWKDKSYSDANVIWSGVTDIRTSTGFTATGEYYNSNSTWTYEALGF